MNWKGKTEIISHNIVVCIAGKLSKIKGLSPSQAISSNELSIHLNKNIMCFDMHADVDIKTTMNGDLQISSFQF